MHSEHYQQTYLDHRSLRYLNAPLVISFNKDVEAWTVVRNRTNIRFRTQQEYKDYVADEANDRFVFEDSDYHLVLVFE